MQYQRCESLYPHPDLNSAKRMLRSDPRRPYPVSASKMEFMYVATTTGVIESKQNDEVNPVRSQFLLLSLRSARLLRINSPLCYLFFLCWRPSQNPREYDAQLIVSDMVSICRHCNNAPVPNATILNFLH